MKKELVVHFVKLKSRPRGDHLKKLRVALK